MTIQSYLVYPAHGRMDLVAASLAALPGCEVLPAENGPMLVLVTETPDQESQRDLERRLESIDNVACLALVSGWTE